MSLQCLAQIVTVEDFEEGGSFPPVGWTTSPVPATAKANWAIQPLFPAHPAATSHSGSYMAFWNSYSVTSGNGSVLVTPVIDWANRGTLATDVTVWWYRDVSASYNTYAYSNEGLAVYVNTTPDLSGATALGFVPRDGVFFPTGGVIGQDTTSTPGWYQYTFQIPVSFNGAVNYLIFNAVSGFGDNCYMDDIQYTSYPPPCTGTPAAGTIVSSKSSGCGSYATTLSLSGSSTSTGLAYTWQSSPDSLNWTLVTGATSTSYAATVTSSIYYRCLVSCTAIGGITSETPGISLANTPANGANLPVRYSVSGSGGYCSGGTGCVVTLSSSDTGVFYQLYSGISKIGTQVSGTGSSLSFGPQTAIATYTVSAVNKNNQCVNTMKDSAVVSIIPLPDVNLVTGGGAYCEGGAGVHIGLNYSSRGVKYQLWSAGNPSGNALRGKNNVLDFGIVFPAGIYSVVATDTTTQCVNFMSGSASVVVNPLPTRYNITGGGTYCVGSGPGFDLTLDHSDPGVFYQLYNGTNPVGIGTRGNGFDLDFDFQVAGGTYTIQALDGNFSTLCADTMAGTAVIVANPSPVVHRVTGGGSSCGLSVPYHVGLDRGDVGIGYQLVMDGFNPVGYPYAGTNGSIDFGEITISGSYTILATDNVTLCDNLMAGKVLISVNPIPVQHTVMGGGTFCTGSSPGINISLDVSQPSISYQLYNNSIPVGAEKTGNGAILDFGYKTASGTYTVWGTDRTKPTACSLAMAGTAVVVANQSPVKFNVTGGGGYCAGSPAYHVGLDNSALGVTYQLMKGGTTPIGAALAGNNNVLDFGVIAPSGNYTVVGRDNITSCASTMNGNALVSNNPVPVSHNVTGGGSFCIGRDPGVRVGLDGSSPQISYQLYNLTAPVGIPKIGTGGTIDFGYQTGNGTYSIIATDRTLATLCSLTMAGTVPVIAKFSPEVFNVTGGGVSCAGSPGHHVRLGNSDIGVSYQLFQGTAPSGLPKTGVGDALDFGEISATGIYTVQATDAVNGCTNNMSGSAQIIQHPLPLSYRVTGGGGYCENGSGVEDSLRGSEIGVKYQLYRRDTLIGAAVAGTGGPISFGVLTAPGVYSVTATNMLTNCAAKMTDSVKVFVNPLPVLAYVTGGGAYCPGSGGSRVGINNSQSAVEYQLFLNNTPVSGSLTGTGHALDFGFQTAVGTYSVNATSPATSCFRDMTGSTNVSVRPVMVPDMTLSRDFYGIQCNNRPLIFTANTVNGGVAPIFQWKVNGVVVDTAVTSSFYYSPMNGDLITVKLRSNAFCASPDTVVKTDTIIAQSLGTPKVTVTANPGTELCTDIPVTLTANTFFGGTNPRYKWIKNHVIVGHESTYSYTPQDGDVIFNTMTSSYPCVTDTEAYSDVLFINVAESMVPSVTLKIRKHAVTGAKDTILASVADGGSIPMFRWYINGTLQANDTAEFLARSTFAEKDSITCSVTRRDACGLSTFNSIVFSRSLLSIATEALVDDVHAYPNPNNGTFTIAGTIESKEGQLIVEMSDMLGHIVYSSTVSTGNNKLYASISTTNLANGIYLLVLRAGEYHKNIHVVVRQ